MRGDLSLYAQPTTFLIEQAREGPRGAAHVPRVVVDHVEVPPDAHPAQAQSVEPPGRELSTDGIGGDERNPQTRDDALLDGLGVAELHARAGRDPRLLERTFHDSTC